MHAHRVGSDRGIILETGCNTLLYDVLSLARIRLDLLRAQAAVHEAPLLERHPPLAVLHCAVRVELLDETRWELLPCLSEVAPQVLYMRLRVISYHMSLVQSVALTSIRPTFRGGIMRVQREVGIARDGEVVHCECVQRLVGIYLVRDRARGADLR